MAELERDEIKRRIDAARTLRGMHQTDLAKLLEADGLGKTDAGRLERGDLTLQRVHRDALSRHLRVPDWWWTAEEIDLSAVPDPRTADIEARLERIEAALGGLADTRDYVREQIRQLGGETDAEAPSPTREEAADPPIPTPARQLPGP